jgi:hypothetical protein
VIYTDEQGNWTGFSEMEARDAGMLQEDFVSRQLVDQKIQFVAIVVPRSVYEELGGFPKRLLREMKGHVASPSESLQ